MLPHAHLRGQSCRDLPYRSGRVRTAIKSKVCKPAALRSLRKERVRAHSVHVADWKELTRQVRDKGAWFCHRGPCAEGVPSGDTCRLLRVVFFGAGPSMLKRLG